MPAAHAAQDDAAAEPSAELERRPWPRRRPGRTISVMRALLSLVLRAALACVALSFASAVVTDAAASPNSGADRFWRHCPIVGDAALRAVVGKPTVLIGSFSATPANRMRWDRWSCVASNTHADVAIEADCGVNPTTDFPTHPETTFLNDRTVKPVAGLGSRAIFLTQAHVSFDTAKDAAVAVLHGTTIIIVSGGFGSLPPQGKAHTQPLPQATLVRLARLAVAFTCARPH